MNATAFFTVAITVLALDAVWLTIRSDYHNNFFQSVQKSPLVARILPAIAIYLLIPTVLTLYAVQTAHSVQEALLKGAVIGAILYGFYDLTNYSTLTNWTLSMTVVDTLWGTTVCAIGSAVGAYVILK
jgi:uncharacterized membrane protein